MQKTSWQRISLVGTTGIHIYIHTYVHIYIHTYTHTHTHTYCLAYGTGTSGMRRSHLVLVPRIYPYIGIHTYLHIVYIHTCIHTYICTYIHAYIYTYEHTYLYTYHTRMRIYMDTCIPTYLHIYIHTYIHTYIYICIHRWHEASDGFYYGSPREEEPIPCTMQLGRSYLLCPVVLDENAKVPVAIVKKWFPELLR